MAPLEKFREKEFLDQITILNEISGSKNTEALPGLIELLKNPVGDTSIDYMVVNALNAVLSSNEDKVVEGLSDPHEGFSILCIRVAGEYAIRAAAEPLVELARSEADLDRLMEILTSLARIGDSVALPVFRTFLDHEDSFIQSSCIEALGKLGDAESIEKFKQIITDSEAPDRFEVCDITTWKAVDALAHNVGEDTISFLVSTLHHKNPTVRRIITDALVNVGSYCIPMLLAEFETGNTDSKILTANVLGFLGDRGGAAGLVAAFDKGLAQDPNVRYAVYEALGRIGTMKGIICLVDGLSETDELILMAVIGGLEKHVNPGMISTLTALIAKADEQSDRLAKAVIASKATAVFDALYENQGAGDALIDALAESKDPEVVEEFRAVLGEIGGSRAQEDLDRLPTLTTGTRKALAADDSRSMCAMHRAILTDLGFEPFMATNGEEAYDYVEQGEEFEVVITDMNMPIMDGMELVGKIRSTPGMEDVPIIMVTTESEASQQGLAAKTGVTAFITKPFKPDDLKAKILEVTGE
ncbi:HEAT repeat domain-containing protein [Pseudodesulfovibrio indicus]|uniref:HEAT repeat protein n=1 Tax=Pseudodesulfovibrio indicus TaxID=1716143 RepID=A0A126QS15_9BACT|nr:HEAT repeat domain-containing protein [Pseudodesulfovibrio indicus]AMK12860.1 response regulator receiver protein [Pseudodesulfovibrio indicus]TDT82031.1 HEAT repeat protein [Pseudodesulfovibrio indicus]